MKPILPVLLALFFILIFPSESVYGQTSGPRCGFIFSSQNNSFVAQTIDQYLRSTLTSINKMRGENGFLRDTIEVRGEGKSLKIKSLNSNTSPTNIAIDLLIQVELLLNPLHSTANPQRLSQILSRLEKMDYHKSTGLLYSWYSTGKRTLVKNKDVSSVDNIHLALALWTIKETFPDSGMGKKAQSLFERMDFSEFYDSSSGLIGGNLKYENGAHYKEIYNFSNLGSEARILYSVGWALGLFRSFNDAPTFLENAFASLNVEVLSSKEGDLLKLWDGAGFQLLFPKIFANEEAYSVKAKEFFNNMGEYIILEGQRRNLPVPAAHSAGRVAIESIDGQQAYRDKSGNKELVSTGNQDVWDARFKEDWDGSFAPNVVFMVGTTQPSRFIPLMLEIQNLGKGGVRLYSSEMGWMDSMHIAGSQKGSVVPVQLALNQGMIALSLLQMRAIDGKGASGRALFKHAVVRDRLMRFYSLFDKKINEAKNQ